MVRLRLEVRTTVSLSVALLFPGSGSLTPADTVTVAELTAFCA